MKCTPYFINKVLIKRPYLQVEWLEQVINNPTDIQIEQSGRIRHWGYITELNRYLRVVTLEDGMTIHNAFPDRRYKGKRL